MKLSVHYHIVKTCLTIIAIICFNNLQGQPVANFSANTTSGCAPFSVSFQDNSTGSPTIWRWDLGNGAISGLRNPSATYFTPGLYTVSLTVTNQYGSSTLTRTTYIKVYDKPVVNFNASTTVGCLPLSTSFTDLSTSSFGSINKWEWDFNDGDTSLLQNPVHTFAAANNYAITLKVTNTNGCATIISKPQYIRVGDVVQAAFNFAAPTNCRPPETISFTNLSTGTGTLSYAWDFGDSNNSAQSDPFHTYLSGGVYSLQLIATSSYGCADTLVRPNLLTIKNAGSGFVSADSICTGQPVNFINTSSPVPLSTSWSFADGTFSFLSNPSKTWDIPGNYLVKLVNNFGTCLDSAVKIIRVLSLPVANFQTADTAGCKAPFTVNFTDQSAGAVSWLWNFGDGTTSTLASPSHIYTRSDSFSVSLTVTNNNGCTAAITKPGFIKVLKPSIAISDVPFEGCLPFTINPVANIYSPDGIAGYQWDFGNGFTAALKNPSATYTLPGNFNIKLVITTNHGCTDSITAINAVKTGTKPLIDFTGLPLTQCAAGNIQFTDLTNPSDKWEWHFGDSTIGVLQNPIHVYNDTGKFSVTLIAWNNGCKDSLTKTDYITTLPPVASFIPLYNCVNKKEIVFTDKSIAPQTWLWNFGDGTTSTAPNPVHSFPLFQNYMVSLTVTNGNCSSTTSLPVHLVTEQAAFTVSKNSLCKSDSVLFKAGIIDPVSIAAYKWDFGDGNILSTDTPVIYHKYLSAGVYSVKLIIKDINGCEDSLMKPNFIRVFGPKAGFIAAPVTGCVPTIVTFTDTSNTDGTNNLATWQWDYGDGQTQLYAGSLPVPLTHAYLTPDSFMVSLKVTDSTGCVDSVTYNKPLIISKPKANFVPSNINICIGSPMVFGNASGGIGLSFLWDFGDGTFSAAPAPVKTYAVNGNYTIKLIVTDVNGCKDSVERPDYIKVQTTLASFTLNDTVSSCTPFKVSFANTSLFSVSQKWDFGDGSTSTLVNPVHYYNAPGTYIAKLTSLRSVSCTSNVTQKITVYPPSAQLTYTPLYGCAPLDVSFHISTAGQVSYLWDFNDGNTIESPDSITTHTYTLPGVFVPKLILKDSVGCLIPITGTDTIRMYSSKVNFGVADSLFCDSGVAIFTDSTISGSAVTSYTWQFGDGSISNDQNPVHTYTAPGLYNVGLFISTVFGCIDSAVKNNYIKVVRTPRGIIAGDSVLCGPGILSFNGLLQQPDTSVIQWQWTFNNNRIYPVQTPTAQQYNTVGVYPMQLIITNSSGCADTIKRSIIIHPLPVTNAGKDTSICLGTAATLHATGADSYSWLPANNLSCINCANPLATLPNSELLYIKGKNIFDCEIKDSVFITVKKPFHLLVTPSADSICIGQSAKLHVSGTENYAWSPATGLSNSSVSNPVASPRINTVYQVIGFDSSHCFYDTAFVNITVFPYPTVNAGPDKTVNIGTAVLLPVQNSSDVVQWLWKPASSLSCNTCSTPLAMPHANTTYTLQVTNNGGCTATDDITLLVTCDNNNLFMPTAFTPNNDQTNDVFFPKAVGVFKIQALRIFNRWGELVFIRSNFLPNDQSAGWDGRYKGQIAAAGNYVYVIEIVCSNNIILSRTGNILLLQ